VTQYSYEEIEVCYLSNGALLSLPVHTLTGGAGPAVGFCAAIHGDEIIGVEILRRVTERLRREELRGTVRIMPVVNALAFEDVNRNTPLDRANLNRSFPGSPAGMLTDRIAHVFLEKFVYTLDALCDLHSGGKEPVVDYVYIQNDEAMSRAFGSKILYRPSVDYQGSIGIYAKEKGVAYMTVEIGGLNVQEADVERGVAGVFNVLRQKGVLAGEAPRREDQIVVSHIEHVNPLQGGLMVPCLPVESIGTIVEGRVVLARVYNPKTLKLLEEIIAPYDRNLIILCRPSINRVYPGDFSFMIGDLATAE
jgi:predicted deacylase